MFQKGNQLAKGRPKISLNKPELLLPIIFQKAHINWARDFTVLYQWYKTTIKPGDKEPSYLEYMSNKARFEMYLSLMPYLCTKIQIKDLDASKFATEADTKAMTAQTKALIEALNVDTESNHISPKTSLEVGKPPASPTA